MDEDRSSRFVWQPGEARIIGIEDMQCIECIHVSKDRAGECAVYSMKPGYIIRKEKDCPDFQKST